MNLSAIDSGVEGRLTSDEIVDVMDFFVAIWGLDAMVMVVAMDVFLSICSCWSLLL